MAPYTQCLPKPCCSTLVDILCYVNLYASSLCACRVVYTLQTLHWPHIRTVRVGHTPSEKGAVGINVLTVPKLLQLRNSALSRITPGLRLHG